MCARKSVELGGGSEEAVDEKRGEMRQKEDAANTLNSFGVSTFENFHIMHLYFTKHLKKLQEFNTVCWFNKMV